jgi:hypothetical protein
MEAWLATHVFEVVLAVILALSSGWVGLTKRQRRQLKECRQQCRKLTTEVKVARADYQQSLEFNFMDRITIRELAKMVRDHRKELGRDEGDILLEVYDRAQSEMRARRLSASAHTTSSPHVGEFLSDE